MTEERETVRQAVILAGGQATRLRPVTSVRPKALVEISGRTILERQAEWLAHDGVEHVVISAGYLADVLREYVDGRQLPLKATVVAEPVPLGRGGGLRFAAGSLPFPKERWLGLNGDILTDLSVAEMCQQHVAQGALATVAIAPLRSPYGIVNINDDDVITDFQECAVLPHWINAGVYLFEPQVRDMLPGRGDHETTTFPALAAQGRLRAFRINGYWRGVDTAKDIKAASADFAEPGTGNDPR